MSVDIKQFLKGLEIAERRIMDAARRGLDIAGEHVIGDAQDITPVLSGDLVASATTLPATINGTKVSKTIGFNTNYAAAVHERLDVKHGGPKNPKGQAKFLEAAMRRNAAKVEAFVGNKVREALK